MPATCRAYLAKMIDAVADQAAAELADAAAIAARPRAVHAAIVAVASGGPPRRRESPELGAMRHDRNDAGIGTIADRQRPRARTRSCVTTTRDPGAPTTWAIFVDSRRGPKR